MADYQKMYGVMVRAASEALDVLPNTEENAAGRRLLQAALYAAEEMYITAEEDRE